MKKHTCYWAYHRQTDPGLWLTNKLMLDTHKLLASVKAASVSSLGNPDL